MNSSPYPGAFVSMLMALGAIALLIGLPIGLAWRIRQGSRQFRQAYHEGRTAGMTPAERHAYDTRTPWVLQFWPLIVVACLVILCLAMPYASPVVLVIWAAKLFNSKKTQRTLTRECTSAHRQETGADQDQSR